MKETPKKDSTQAAFIAFAALIAAVVTGCAEVTAVRPAEGGTLTVASNSGLGRTSTELELNKAIKAANDYCSALGQQTSIVNGTTRPGSLGRVAVGRVNFRCVAAEPKY